MISQNTPAPSTTYVSFELYFTCMKNSTTSVAFTTRHRQRDDDVQVAEIDEGDARP